jgi:tetratricopeptide (TPR) repeat protein
MRKDTPQSLLDQATTLLQTSQPDEALPLAKEALSMLERSDSGSAAEVLPALTLVAEIHVELGDVTSAREAFLRAAEIDPDGLLLPAEKDGGGGGGDAEKFLWLAQLCEEGGQRSVDWFERGVGVLRRQIQSLEALPGKAGDAAVEEKKEKLSQALCGIAEVYMTDLSWEEEAEKRCDAAVTEAVMIAPNSPEPLQTLASVRISQLRIDEAKAALARSLELWKDLPAGDAKVPAFPTRISLVRLLLEAEMHEEALDVLERLVAEDDQSVEAWYLGGWCLYLMGENAKAREGERAEDSSSQQAERVSVWRASKEWLENSLKLCEALDYEDDRLRDHARELVSELDQQLKGLPKGLDEGDDEDAGSDGDWEDESDHDTMDEDKMETDT